MSRSIIDAKEAFLRAQIRLLSAPLSPSDQWQEFAEEPQEGDLPAKVVEDALQKVNGVAKNHNRAVYSSQALRAVAEQIDTLYTEYATRGDHDPTDRLGGVALAKDSDLTLASNIALLPEEWAPVEGAPAPANQEEQYVQLRHRLVELDEQRAKLREKLTRYKQLQAHVSPLKDPKVNVQPNLVTKDGDLASELERTRVLLARVTGKIGQSAGQGLHRVEDDANTPMVLTGDEKLKVIFNGT